jgi:hypothetical protein
MTVGLLGCSQDSDRPDLSNPTIVERALSRAVAAFDERDRHAMCELLSEPAKEIIGSTAHAKPTRCIKDVRRFFKWLKPFRAGTPRVVKVSGSETERRARATVLLPNETIVEIPFVAENDRWKLNGLFDATLSKIQGPAIYEPGKVETAPKPDALPGKGEMVVSRQPGDRQRCPGVSASGFPEVDGGCVVEIQGNGLQLTLQSPFGVMAFARCSVVFDVHVDGNGDAWAADFTPYGKSPCPDVVGCRIRGSVILPWRARIERAAGGMTLQVRRGCLDTCIGRFVGDMTFDLYQDGPAWRLRAKDAMVGRTGWQFDGDLHTDEGRATVSR